jgi:hypothetical protein
LKFSFYDQKKNRVLFFFFSKLVLNEKGFMGRRKTNVLHEGEGIIRNIKWCNDLIAWSNDRVDDCFINIIIQCYAFN